MNPIQIGIGIIILTGRITSGDQAMRLEQDIDVVRKVPSSGICSMRDIQNPGIRIVFNTGRVPQITKTLTVDRAILVGAQALASAYGNTGQGSFFGYHEEKTDHENTTEISVRWIQGISKVRFANAAGRVNDDGVMVLDTAITTDGLSSAN